MFVFGTKFKGDAAYDQSQQQQHQCQIQPAEESGVHVRESGKHGAASGDEPDFIAIPMGANGVDDHPPLLIVLGDEGQHHAHAEVKTLQEEEADEQHCHQYEPNCI